MIFLYPLQEKAAAARDSNTHVMYQTPSAQLQRTHL
jgi:hypothetical protein